MTTSTDRTQRIIAIGYWLTVATVIVVGYVWVHGRLTVHYLDDAWSTSFAYQFMRHDITEDRVFRTAGTTPLLFGKTQAWLYGTLIAPFGWTRSHVHLIASAVQLASAAAWAGIGRSMGLGREAATYLGVSLLLFGVGVKAANLGRPDALTLLLISLALLAFVRARWLLAGLLVVVAFENHPIGLTGLFYLLGWGIHTRADWLRDRRRALQRLGLLALGALLGLCWFVWANRATLTAANLGKMFRGVQTFGEEQRTEWTYLHYYFKYHARPELYGFLTCFALFLVRRRDRHQAAPLWLLAMVLLSAVLARRQNEFYALLAYPAFALVCVHALADAGRLRNWLLRLGFLLLLANFAVQAREVWRERKTYHFEQTLAEVVQRVPADGLPVVGLSDFWFGFQERRFVPHAYQSPFPTLGFSSFYLVDSSIKPTGLVRIRGEIGDQWWATPIATFADSATTQVRILRYDPAR